MTDLQDVKELNPEQQGRIRGRVVMIARLLSPLRHGGETRGNVQTFRRQKIQLPSQPGPYGEEMPPAIEDVPYLSGNSIKHFIREHAALFALEALGAKSGSLSKEQIHLLFSGGSLTKGGQSVRFDVVRAAEKSLPVLSLCGYSAGNIMTSAAFKVDDLLPVCAETAHLIRAEVNQYAGNAEVNFMTPIGRLMDVNFGTRHEPTKRSHIADYLRAAEAAELEMFISDNKDTKHADKGDSAQMIYEYEQMAAGTYLVGGFTFDPGVSSAQLQAFRSAFLHASEGTTADGGLIVRFGGASSKGFGKVAVWLHGLVAQGVEPWRYENNSALCPPRGEGEGFDAAMTEYIKGLREAGEAGLISVQELMK